MATPVSVGQLLAMSEAARTATIRELSPTARRKLAHLAVLGAHGCAERAMEFIESGREKWCRDQIDAARSRTYLAAKLTTEPEEL